MAYSASPIDFDAGLACNGNNLSFYLGHLRRFAQDTSLVALSDALMQGNVSQAFLLAHTLKGLSSQLAVTCVYLPAAELCDLLRDGKAENLQGHRKSQEQGQNFFHIIPLLSYCNY